MVEYIVRTDKPIRLDEVLHLHGVHNFEVKRMDKHGDLIERNELPIIGITDYKLESHTVVEFEDILNAPTVVEANR